MHILIISPYEHLDKLSNRNCTLSNFISSPVVNRLIKLFKKLTDADLTKDNFIKVIGEPIPDKWDDSFAKSLKKDNWSDLYLKDFAGSIGCSLSHVKALRYIQENKIEEDVLILEDDADINPSFKLLIPNPFPADYDIFIMHNPCQANFDCQEETNNKNIRKIKSPPIKGTLGAYMYFVNGKNINKIIDNSLPLEWQVDISLTANKKLIKYILNPALRATWDVDYSSYRKALNQISVFSACKWLFYFSYPQENGEIVSRRYKFKLTCHRSMIHEAPRENIFKFTIIDENDKIIENINNFIEVRYPLGRKDYEDVIIKIRGDDILEDYKSYTLKVEFFNKNFYYEPLIASKKFIYSKMGIGLDILKHNAK